MQFHSSLGESPTTKRCQPVLAGSSAVGGEVSWRWCSGRWDNVKRWPAGMALATNESFPIRESRSRFVVRLQWTHIRSSMDSLHSFSGGRQISCCTESNFSPRKVRVVAGPSTLSEVIGNPRLLHTWRKLAR